MCRWYCSNLPNGTSTQSSSWRSMPRSSATTQIAVTSPPGIVSTSIVRTAMSRPVRATVPSGEARVHLAERGLGIAPAVDGLGP